MTQQETTQRLSFRDGKARVNAAPEISVRLVGALLALAVATVHIADQGTITALTSPHWIGWGYRLIEVGGVLTAFAVLLSRPAWMAGRPGCCWESARSSATSRPARVGVPGDPGDVGNWGYWIGTVSLFVEAALIVLSATMLLALRNRQSVPG